MQHKINPQWYRNAFRLENMIGLPWTYHTKKDVDVLQKILNLTGNERILDIACGFGRHSLELAARGFQVVGIDIADELINCAREKAKQSQLRIEFICSDLRNLSFSEKFDVILNLYDGAIGYLENEIENNKVFELIASSLKYGGKHIMHIPNPGYARKYFPQRTWREADKMIELIENTWNPETHIMVEAIYPVMYGDIFEELQPSYESKRIYEVEEIEAILKKINMRILHIFGELEEDSVLSDDYNYFSVLSMKL